MDILIHKELNRTAEIVNQVWYMVKNKDWQNKILLSTESELLSLWFEEVKDTRHAGRYWKPENHNTRHYCLYDGYIANSNNTAISDYKYWNAFETQELAQKELDKIKAIVKIMEYISDNFWIFEPNWNNKNQRKYRLYYNHDNKSFGYEILHYCHWYSPIWYFSCSEHANYIIKKFDKELKLIYDIKL